MKTTAATAPKTFQAMVRETMGPGYQVGPSSRLLDRVSHSVATSSHSYAR